MSDAPKDVYDFHTGTTPLLVSVPHDGRQLLPGMRYRMTPAGLDMPDTDWHVTRLYDFAREIGASVIVANYSRYVIDLNRPPDDGEMYAGQLSTGLCPRKSFAGHDIYIGGAAIDAHEIKSRRREFWKPYHEQLESTLDMLRERFGYALLWDAHSIPSTVPSLFDGLLPELNLGSYDGRSAAPHIGARVAGVGGDGSYELVVDGRFKGGYITRHHGRPDRRVHALQLEIAQRAYMDEEQRTFDDNKAARLRDLLRRMLKTFLEAAAERSRQA